MLHICLFKIFRSKVMYRVSLFDTGSLFRHVIIFLVLVTYWHRKQCANKGLDSINPRKFCIDQILASFFRSVNSRKVETTCGFDYLGKLCEPATNLLTNELQMGFLPSLFFIFILFCLLYDNLLRLHSLSKGIFCDLFWSFFVCGMLQYIGNSSWLSNSVLKERGLKKQLCSVYYIFPTSGPRTYVSIDTVMLCFLLVREPGCLCEFF
jgi:hypothetical protein